MSQKCPSCGGNGTVLRENQAICVYCGTELDPKVIIAGTKKKTLDDYWEIFGTILAFLRLPLYVVAVYGAGFTRDWVFLTIIISSIASIIIVLLRKKRSLFSIILPLGVFFLYTILFIRIKCSG